MNFSAFSRSHHIFCTFRFNYIKVERLGGSFDDVTVEWKIQQPNETDVSLSDFLNPISGVISFEAGQTEVQLEINITIGNKPLEAVPMEFRLF